MGEPLSPRRSQSSRHWASLRADYAGAFLACLAGGVSTLVLYFSEKYVLEYDYAPQWPAETALGHAVAGVGLGITLIVVSLLTPPPSREQLEAVVASPVDDDTPSSQGVRATY